MQPRVRNALVLRNMRIVYQVVRAVAAGPDADDMTQAGTIGLITAVERYDPNKGAFYSFAKLHILNEIQQACKVGKGLSPRSRAIASEMREVATEILYGCAHGGDHSATEARMMLSQALAAVPPEHVAAVLLHCDGAGVADVARTLGVPQEVARLLLETALERARKALA